MTNICEHPEAIYDTLDNQNWISFFEKEDLSISYIVSHLTHSKYNQLLSIFSSGGSIFISCTNVQKHWGFSKYLWAEGKRKENGCPRKVAGNFQTSPDHFIIWSSILTIYNFFSWWKNNLKHPIQIQTYIDTNTIVSWGTEIIWNIQYNYKFLPVQLQFFLLG